MNYQKIYQDFIASRRLREADIVGYSEKHHIVPKALGGGNEKANLIRLTPEDHFFAHCCLAKAHGREMWSALWLMLRTQNTARCRRFLHGKADKNITGASSRATIKKHERIMGGGAVHSE